MSKRNSSVLWTVEQSLSKAEKERARTNIGINFVPAPDVAGNTLSFVETFSENNSNGEITFTRKNVTVDSQYNDNGTNPVNGKAITDAFATLHPSGDTLTVDAGYYLSSITQTNGIISIGQTKMDTTPTSNSKKPVTSGGVYDAIKEVKDKVDGLDLAKVGGTGKYVKWVQQDDGQLSAEAGDVVSTYSASGTEPINGTGVKAAIALLDKTNITGFGKNKTLSALSETDGIISASFQTIEVPGFTKFKQGSLTLTAEYNDTINVYDDDVVNLDLSSTTSGGVTTKKMTLSHRTYFSGDQATPSSADSTVSTSITIPWINCDKYGHVTAVGQYVKTVPTAQSGVFKVKYDSSDTAVTTGFNANSSSDVTYTFQHATGSQYGVTKLTTYSSSMDWTAYSTANATAATPQSVYEYVNSAALPMKSSSNPDWTSISVNSNSTFYNISSSAVPQTANKSPEQGTLFLLAGGSGAFHTQLAMGENIKYRSGNANAWQDWENLVRSANNTAVGSTMTPVYIDANGVAHECTDLAGVFRAYISTTSSHTMTTYEEITAAIAANMFIYAEEIVTGGGSTTSVPYRFTYIRPARGAEEYIFYAFDGDQYISLTCRRTSGNTYWDFGTWKRIYEIDVSGNYDSSKTGTIFLL